MLLERKKTGLVVLLAIFFILFAGLRASDVDKDYESYLISFSVFLNPADYFVHYSDWVFFEPMYYLVPSIVRTIFSPDSNVPIFLFYAMLGVATKFYALRKLTELFYLSLFCYFSYFFLLHEMTQVRAGVVSGVLLMVVYFAYHKKYLVSTLLILFGCLFQYSAIFIFLLFLVKKQSDKFLFYKILMLASLVLAFVDTSFMFSLMQVDLGPITARTSTYTELNESGKFVLTNKLNALFIINFLTTSLYIYFAPLISQRNKYANYLVKIQVLGLFFFQLFSAIPPLAFRIFDLFAVVSIITLTFFTYLFSNRWVGFAVTACIAIVILMITLVYGGLLNNYHLALS